MAIQQQRFLGPAAQLRSAKFRFGAYLVTTSLLVVFFAWLSVNALIDNHYRNDPATQTITATVTSTKQDCTRSGCYYDSYGTYSITGTREQNVKVVSLANMPVTGQVPILVNPRRTLLAMSYYSNPYPGQAIAFGSLASFFVLWNGFLYFVLYRWAMRRFVTPAAAKRSVGPLTDV